MLLKKFLAPLVLFSASIGCNETHSLNYVQLQIGTAPLTGYYLLRVDDSAMTVTPRPRPMDTIEKIQFNAINRMYIQRSTTTYTWLGAGAGYLVGIAILYATTTPIERSDGLAGIFVEPLIPLGAIVGCKLADGMQEVDIGSKDQRLLLRQRAGFEYWADD
ncbi:MAG TPA: hypothetical protein VEW28_10605 [Candidatus Kapabacteria bacterium]|nr:hypothetical protein [Candidatus Kapabacteria bacterium]